MMASPGIPGPGRREYPFPYIYPCLHCNPWHDLHTQSVSELGAGSIQSGILLVQFDGIYDRYQVVVAAVDQHGGEAGFQPS